MNKERGAWLLPEGQKVWVEGREVPIVEEYKNQRQLLRECRDLIMGYEIDASFKDFEELLDKLDNKLEGEDE
jgi:hypothetical protein